MQYMWTSKTLFTFYRDEAKINRTTGGDVFSVVVEYLGLKHKCLGSVHKEVEIKSDSTIKNIPGCYSIIKREDTVNIEEKCGERVLVPGIKIQDLNNGR